MTLPARRDASKKSTHRNLMDDVMSDTEELSLEAAFDFVNLGGYDTALTIPAGGTPTRCMTST